MRETERAIFSLPKKTDIERRRNGKGKKKEVDFRVRACVRPRTDGTTVMTQQHERERENGEREKEKNKNACLAACAPYHYTPLFPPSPAQVGSFRWCSAAARLGRRRDFFFWPRGQNTDYTGEKRRERREEGGGLFSPLPPPSFSRQLVHGARK